MEPSTKGPQTSASFDEAQAQRRRQRHEARASSTYHDFLTLASAELSMSPPECEPVLMAVVSALEQRLPFDEMSDLASQLPYKLRELIASCDEPRERLRPRDIGRAELLQLVARDLSVDEQQAEAHTRAVFRVLAQTISRGEIEQVIQLLPRPLRELWPPLG